MNNKQLKAKREKALNHLNNAISELISAKVTINEVAKHQQWDYVNA